MSERNTAVQLGSRPRTGNPAETYGASTSTVRCSTRRAMSSWPVEIQVRPQHTARSGTTTRNPAASSAPTAAAAMPGANAVVNVSGKSTTPPRTPEPAGRRRRIHRSKRAGANRGRSRSGSTPASRLTTPPIPGRWVAALARSGASAAARAASGSQPSE